MFCSCIETFRHELLLILSDFQWKCKFFETQVKITRTSTTTNMYRIQYQLPCHVIMCMDRAKSKTKKHTSHVVSAIDIVNCLWISIIMIADVRMRACTHQVHSGQFSFIYIIYIYNFARALILRYKCFVSSSRNEIRIKSIKY